MQQSPSAVPRLELRHASKSFGRVRALSDGDLALWPGEVHALLGENGAGKSTVVKILAGVHQPDTGELLVDGVARRFSTPAEARDAGLAVIYQEPTLFFDLSIAENIFMGRQPVDRIGRIQYDAMRREVDGLLASLGVEPARGSTGAWSVDCRSAGDRNRESVVVERERADHGRTDRRLVAA